MGGRRYSNESKLNYAKIVAVIIAIAVIIMFVVAIKQLLTIDVSNITTKTEYYPVYSEEKWGVIDSSGKEIISPSYAEMIIIPDNTKDVFLCVYEIDVASNTYKTKALNKKNKEIFTEYEQIEALENFDESDNVWYESNVLKVKKDGKYGLINLDGRVLLDCEYDNIYALEGITNSLITVKDEKLGLVDNTGRVVIEPNYVDIEPLGKTSSEGYITVNEEQKYGVIGANKEQKLENNYEKIEKIYGSNLFVVVEDGKQKLVNSKGTTVLEEGFDEIKQIMQKVANQIIIVKDGLYGIINTSGETIIPNTYDSLKELENGAILAEKDGKYGIIDNEGNEKIFFNYTSISYNSTLGIYIAEDSNYESSIIDKDFKVRLIGILSELNESGQYIKMRINDEYKYYNLSFEEVANTEVLKGRTLFLSKKNGKYGYIDSEGNVVVDYIYNDATEQNEFGFAAVQKNGLWGSIDSDGKTVVEPKYNLDNNIIINFIGKWHLGEDLNMNYYCEE